jgi:cold shock protein
MSQGTVKTWMQDRGFGFITDDDGTDVFVHVKSLPNSLQALDPLMRVQFDTKKTARGLQAVNIVLVEDGSDAVDLSGAIPEAQFLREVLEMLPSLREAYQQKILDWGKSHGWVSD